MSMDVILAARVRLSSPLLLFPLLLIVCCRREGDQGPKEDVLSNRQLAQHFSFVHLEHAFVHLGPCLDARNVVEHRRVPAQRRRLHFVDESDAGQIHIIAAELLSDLVIMDRLGAEVAMRNKLPRSPNKGEKMIVVETPNTVRARRLEPVRGLDVTHDSDVFPEDAEHDAWPVRHNAQQREFHQAETKWSSER